jgi:hypothetical protein
MRAGLRYCLVLFMDAQQEEPIMSNEPAASESASRSSSGQLHHIVVRPLPKFVIMYPTFFVALVAGILLQGGWGDARLWTLIFLATYFLNSLVLTFDFDRITSIAVTLFVVVVLLLVHQFEVGIPIIEMLSRWEPTATAPFFFGMAGLMFIIFVWMFIDTRFDYWEITPNELMHHHGFLGDVERFPAPNLSMKKEIHDVFEFLLLGSGRLIFYPSGKDRAVILDNVMRINSVEHKVKSTLDALRVRIERFPDAPG